MFTKEQIRDEITHLDAPAIPGLLFRHFRGESDYPHMVAVIEGSKTVDQVERTDSVEDVAHSYAHLTHCDPYQDMVFAEIHGQVIGYSRVFWDRETEGDGIYTSIGFVLPEWRHQGIGSAMLRHNERRLRTIAARHTENGDRLFQAYSSDTEETANRLYKRHGYEIVRYFFEMVRRPLDEFPPAPMPEGLEVRPVKPDHIPVIWKAMDENFRDHWGHVPFKDEELEERQAHHAFNPDLWKVAWDGDQVAGMVLNFINHKENAEYHRKRGYTEDISVGRPWRRQGLARSLLVQSMQLLRDHGMEETALGVDTENPSGALRLYESVGYRTYKTFYTLRKPMEA